MKRAVTNCFIRSEKIGTPVCLAVAADLHNSDPRDLLPLLQGVDAVLAVGDLVDRYHQRWDRAIPFLREASKCAPTYVSVGNHERRLTNPDAFWEEVGGTGAIVLNQTVARLNGDVVLGGFSSWYHQEVDASVVEELAELEGFRLLMCHHPEYYPKYVKGTGIDLTVSGHAHGGQVRLFGLGLYAPGQGILPKLTGGFYDDRRLLVSRGLSNPAHFPRLWNPCELVLLHLLPEGV